MERNTQINGKNDDDQKQDQQEQNINVTTKGGSTWIQTGNDSVQIDGDNDGGIHQTFN